MDTFPKLTTGASAQYGSSRETRFNTEVLRFLDGREQRMLQRRVELQWNLVFDYLTEDEVRRIADFFHRQHGTVNRFRFEDPWTNEVVANCIFAQDEIEFEWMGPNRARTNIRIRKEIA